MIYKKTFLLILGLILKFGAILLGFLITKIIYNFDENSLTQYNSIVAFTSILLSIINLGIPQIIQKYYTKNDTKYNIADIWTSLNFLRLISYFFGILIILFSLKFLNLGDLFSILGIFTMQFILLADINFRSVCDANNKSWQFSITDFFSKLLFLILLYLGSINKQNNLNYYVYTGLFVYIIFILLDQFIHRKSVFFSSVNFSFLKEIFPALIHLSISGIIFSSYITTDRLFIKYTSSDYALNSYSLGYKLFETYAVASGILMPILASSVKKNIDLQRLYFLDKLKHSFLKKIKIKYLSIAESLMLSLSLGLGLSLSSFVLSPFILKFLDPQNIFIESIDYIKILSIALIFLPSISLLAFLIIFLNKEQYELYTGIIMMAVTLSLYWILITNYGGYGAAWATTVATIFDLFILKIYFLYKSIKNYD